MSDIDYLEKPNLYSPYMIMGFEGWPNASEVSSFALNYLIENLMAKRFASIPIENFYELSSLRPTAKIKGGRLVDLKFPENNFYYKKNPLDRDIILFYGNEPHLRWEIFTNLILDLAEEFGVSQIFTIGGTYDFVPHTYPPMVSALFNHEDLREGIIEAGLGLTEYSGPISIHTFILEASKKRGLKAISLWGHAPQYLQVRNVKVVFRVLKKLIYLTKIQIDLSNLERESEYFDQQVNELVKQDPKLQEVISKLEEVYKRSDKESLAPKGDEKSKEDKVIYIQAYLKREDDDRES